ncbi:MAG: aspartate--tRNA(Asn) ligase [Thermoplasmataceae archaeon]
MERHTVSQLKALTSDTEVMLHGWIQDIRVMKNIIFLVFRDHTGIAQLTVKRDSWKGIDLESVSRESAASATGTFLAKGVSKIGPEILLKALTVLNPSKSPLPLAVSDPVNSDIETRLNHRFLDLRKKEVNMVFQAQSKLLWGIRKFLSDNGFVEVHTPKVVAAATEGGSDLFRVQYFEKETYLNQSPQLYKEILISAGLNRVFEVGPAFRAEKHNTVRHLNEFTSVDIEMAFSDHNDAMRMLEGSVRSGISEVSSSLGKELGETGHNISIPEIPFPRITYEDSVKYIEGHGEKINFGDDFSPEQLKILGNQFHDFYFITKWPAVLRPFYTMPDPTNSEFTNSFDLQYQEKEITSGAQRVHDPQMLVERFHSKGLREEDFSFYLESFMYGMPPHAGWGLGLERLCMILLDLPNIREATLFPRDRNRISP